MKQFDDTDVWPQCPNEDLWVFDKLIVARKSGHVCGPHGVSVPSPGMYIVRPCVNLMGMGRSAEFQYIENTTDDIMKDGMFWSEIFSGRHLSVDYEGEKQVLCVEGIREDSSPLWRWKEWRRTDDKIPFPDILRSLLPRHKYFNVEMIGGKIIEIHLRHNPDFKDRPYTSLIPVFKGFESPQPEGYTFVEDIADSRLGFYAR